MAESEEDMKTILELAKENNINKVCVNNRTTPLAGQNFFLGTTRLKMSIGIWYYEK